MNKPLVSIVMPCYQNSMTLARTVQSIQAQTFEDWELIAVDDGSKDDTLAVLTRLAAAEPRMRVIHQENGGVSAARNAGMDAAQGQWISFVDADDHLLKHALEHLLAMVDDRTDIICGAYEMHFRDEGGRIEKHACASGDLQTVLESLVRGDSALNSMCARLYRAQLLRDHAVRAPKGIKVGEDVLFNLDAFIAARAWRMSGETIYIYEFGGDSAMTRARTDVYGVSVPMIEGIGSFVRQHSLQTALFRAHIDIYVRTLRAARGRFGAALALSRAMVAAMTDGVEPARLPAKQKLYYFALRALPLSSFLLP
ncbi:MAG: glycosyltransferase family 2 protein [Clostridia bacterium]|nr:glycosyltransferase family 2 protein [Clostridia bacterium]